VFQYLYIYNMGYIIFKFILILFFNNIARNAAS